MSKDRVKMIEETLKNAFSPQHLLVKDQSHLHAGHAGAQDGRGHFSVDIVSDDFAAKPPIQRHRAVYEALGELMQTDIHALKINAKTSTELA